MKIHKTSKLFYGKYPFRIEVRINGGDVLARNRHNLDKALKNITNTWRYKDFSQNSINELRRYSNKYSELDQTKFKQRVEGQYTKFYTENRTDHEVICRTMQDWVTDCYEPENDDDLDKLFTKKNVVLRKRYPHGGLQFRIILKNRIPQSRKTSFLNWLENYADDIHMTELTRRYLRESSRYSEGYSIYVRNEKLLMIIGLFLGSDIKKIEEFVLRGTQINSVPEDELCPT